MAGTYLQVSIHLGDRDPDQVAELAATRIQDSPVPSLISILSAVAGGTMKGRVLLAVADDTGTAATSTIACTQANAAGDYVRCAMPGGDVTFTEGVDFQDGATDDDTGENLAAAINAHATVGKVWSAVNASGTVTLTALHSHFSSIPNDIGWTTDDATAFAITNDATSAPNTTQHSLLDHS